MSSKLISFLRNLEVEGKLRCDSHFSEEKFKNYLLQLEISGDEKAELEKLFDEAIVSTKEEFFKLGTLLSE